MRIARIEPLLSHDSCAKRRSPRAVVICLLMMLYLLAVIGCQTSRSGSTKAKKIEEPPPANTSPPPPQIPDAMYRALTGASAPQPGDESQGIIVQEQTMRIAPGKHYAFSVAVPADTPSRKLTGQFSAVKLAGADGTDLHVFVTDEAGYSSFQSSGSYRTYYIANRASEGLILAELHPGKYYVVFDNPQSVDRAVNAVVHLSKR